MSFKRDLSQAYVSLRPTKTITIVKCKASVILDAECPYDSNLLKLSAVILVRIKIACHHCSVTESGKVDNNIRPL